MYVVKMEKDKTLFPTVESRIFEGESGVEDIVFLVQQTYDGINISDCVLVCRYILADGSSGSEVLEADHDLYADEMYQYRLPVGSKMTSIAGRIEIWLTAMNYQQKMTLKTDSLFIPIFRSKNITDLSLGFV